MEKRKKTWRERAGPAFAAVKGRVASPADGRQGSGLQVRSLLMDTMAAVPITEMEVFVLEHSTLCYVCYNLSCAPNPWRGPVEKQGMATWNH